MMKPEEKEGMRKRPGQHAINVKFMAMKNI